MLKILSLLCAVSTLSQDGEYAGNDVIVAFTRAFSSHVTIHQLNCPRWEILAPCATSATPTLHIAYLKGEHYCSVKPIFDTEKTMTNAKTTSATSYLVCSLSLSPSPSPSLPPAYFLSICLSVCVCLSVCLSASLSRSTCIIRV